MAQPQIDDSNEAGRSGSGLVVPVGEVLAVPGVVGMLDGGVPWIRGQAELDEEWRRLVRAVRPLLVDWRADAPPQDGRGQWLTGAMAAARWTTGLTQVAPTTSRPEPVTGGSICRQLAAAEAWVVERDRDWPFATGILSWILWITGAREELTYPGGDTPRW